MEKTMAKYQEFESQAEDILNKLLAENAVSREMYDLLLEEEKKRTHLDRTRRRKAVREELRKIIEQSQD
jgi:hypothetical protein